MEKELSKPTLNLKKAIFWSVIAVFVLVTLVLAFLFSLEMKLRYDQNKKIEELISFDLDAYLKENGEEIKLQEADTSDWQTYTDKERGFSFKYPKDWVAEEIPVSPSQPDKTSLTKFKYIPLDYHGLEQLVREDDFLCVHKGTDVIKDEGRPSNNICAFIKFSEEVASWKYQSSWAVRMGQIMESQERQEREKEKNKKGDNYKPHYVIINDKRWKVFVDSKDKYPFAVILFTPQKKQIILREGEDKYLGGKLYQSYHEDVFHGIIQSIKMLK